MLERLLTKAIFQQKLVFYEQINLFLLFWSEVFISIILIHIYITQWLSET